jgi:hypothetical protein
MRGSHGSLASTFRQGSSITNYRENTTKQGKTATINKKY